MLAKRVKCLRSGRSAARSGCSLGGSFSHLGPPTEPKRMASLASQMRKVVSGKALPWLSMPAPPTSAAVGLEGQASPAWRRAPGRAAPRTSPRDLCSLRRERRT